jgi:hypothetical protein
MLDREGSLSSIFVSFKYLQRTFDTCCARKWQPKALIPLAVKKSMLRVYSLSGDVRERTAAVVLMKRTLLKKLDVAPVVVDGLSFSFK